MARPREFDQTEVLEALKEVFWEKGYEGTSYADISKATGLLKGSLYAAFGDKRALYQRALSQYEAEDVQAGISMLRDSSITSKARIHNMFQAVIDSAGTPKGQWGCLLCNAAIDQAPLHETTKTQVNEMMTRLEAAIAFALDDDGLAGMAPMILSAYFGTRVLVKGGANAKKIAAIKATIMQSVFNET